MRDTCLSFVSEQPTPHPASLSATPGLTSRPMQLDNLPVEVFGLILRTLDSKHLLHCALVCERWRDLALDVKWKEHVVELADLVRGLGPAPSNRSCEETERALASPWWLRVNRLRKMITKLKVSSSPPTHITYLQHLQSAVEPPGQAFCPNLRSIELDRMLPQPDLYDFLVGASLQNLILRHQSSSRTHLQTVVTNTLKKIAGRSPRVEDVLAYSSSSVFDFGVFPKLRVLTYGGNVSVASWNQLCAGCPLLERVNIWPPGRAQAAEDETGLSDPPAPTLPFLQSLDMDSIKHSSLVTYIMRMTHMSALTELAVDFVNIGKAEGNALLSLLRDRNPSMTRLMLKGDTLNLATLGFFTQLRNLQLRAPLNTFTIECLERIIKSNPHLIRLTISYSTDTRIRPKLNPSLLETVAQACNDISVIRIPLDTLDTPWTLEESIPLERFKRLCDLVLIQPDAMEPFARYLARLCPTLDSFETSIMHPGRGQGTIDSEELTHEEVENSALMEDLFYEAQEGDSWSDPTLV
ncbi:hypothetical protein FRB90_002137 [Tulasnella sp. 427]|nr:hypothetical protein FRB90_002137 [Tulasnella sp. 427]